MATNHPTTPTITVSPFTPSDAQAVPNLILTIQETELGGADPPHEAADLYSIPATYTSFYVAHHNQTVVGTAALKDLGNSSAMLKRMYVLPAYRGKEIGTARLLLDAVKEGAKRDGLRCIYLGTSADTPRALAFYARQAAVEVRTEELPENAVISECDTHFFRIDVA